LQALLSVHEEPFGTGVYVQPKTASQVSVVQTFVSLHVRAVPVVQAPP
jgi:hypothetical protein